MGLQFYKSKKTSKQIIDGLEDVTVIRTMCVGTAVDIVIHSKDELYIHEIKEMLFPNGTLFANFKR